MMKKPQHLISINDLSRSQIERLIAVANKFREGRPTRRSLPSSFILGLLFFQESTRTRIGFQVACQKLGGQAFFLNEAKFTKEMSHSESLEDTFQVLQSYADLTCIRHSDENVFSRLLPYAKKPIINCGNGSDEHPTQTLTDLMTIQNLLGKIDGLKIAIVGNLRDMRTAHSLLLGLSNFRNVSVTLISPANLTMPQKYIKSFDEKGVDNMVSEARTMDLKGCDVVYITGFPSKARGVNIPSSVRNKYQMNEQTIKLLKPGAIILDPLPREDEILPKVDLTEFAKYFTQSENGLYMRMAVLSEVPRLSTLRFNREVL